MQHNNKTTLFIIAFIAIVNALGYGIIVPLQYAYVSRFGINTFWVGILFASFSLAQFVATPVIGRLSDRFGRKPLLFYSVFGTAISFFLMAIARSAPVIFAARILDGISGGNISVAQAVISDTTEPKDRAKWFGILGAAFGFGFVFGPALGGLMSNFSMQMPFYFAGLISLVGATLVMFVLRETATKEKKENKPVAKIFDFKKLYFSLFEPYVGLVLIANFIVYFAFSVFILGFQAFTNDVLKLSPSNIAVLFMIFGIIGLIIQGFGVGRAVKRFGEINVLLFGAVVTCISFFLMGLSTTFTLFVMSSIVLALGNSFLGPVLTALLSKHTKPEDQGGMMGINQSYGSLGNIIGPVVGGILASTSTRNAFFGAGASLLLLLYLVMILRRESGKHVVNL